MIEIQVKSHVFLRTIIISLESEEKSPLFQYNDELLSHILLVKCGAVVESLVAFTTGSAHLHIQTSASKYPHRVSSTGSQSCFEFCFLTSLLPRPMSGLIDYTLHSSTPLPRIWPPINYSINSTSLACIFVLLIAFLSPKSSPYLHQPLNS